MTLMFDGVQLFVEVAFTSTPGDTTPTWADITDYVLSAEWGRGRQRELERPEPGTATITLENSTRRFDPYYNAGPYFGNLLPMKQIRIWATYSATDYDLWYGYVDSWSQEWSDHRSSTCTVTATDAMRVLADRTLIDPYFYEVRSLDTPAESPIAYLRLGENGGKAGEGPFRVTDAISKTRGQMYGSVSGVESLVYKQSDGAIDFNGDNNKIIHRGAAHTGPFGDPMSVECWFQTDTTSLGLLVRQGDGEENDGWFIWMWPTGQLILASPFISVLALITNDTYNDGLIHHLVWTITGAGTQAVYIDGVLAGTAVTAIENSAFDGLIVGGTTQWNDYIAATIDEVAVYDYVLSFAQILTHFSIGAAPYDSQLTGERIQYVLDQLGIPYVADANNVMDGNSTLGPIAEMGMANALDYILSIVDVEAGNFWIKGDGNIRFRERHAVNGQASSATFGSSGAEIKFLEARLAPADELIRNDVTVTAQFGTDQNVQDATSITSYLTRSWTSSGLPFKDDNESAYYAQWVLDKYKEPLNRVDQLVWSPRRTPTTGYPLALGLDLDATITVNVRPAIGTGDPITEVALIESIRHSVGLDFWETTYALSPADTRTYLIFDSASYGQFDQERISY